jgi:hypothetical protein
MKNILAFFLFVIVVLMSSLVADKGKITFKQDSSNKKVDVFVDGKFFTAFIYPDSMEKQSLYPILSASGKTITRGYPMNPRPFERIDHPHHVGLWFNFGDVNGLDFWNNSFAIPAADKHKYGTIKFKKIIELNERKGMLVVESEWVDVQGKVLLNEKTSYIFTGNDSSRSIERVAELTAVQNVIFNENKEGLIGLRVDRAFEEPSTKAEKFLDAKGIETEVPVLNNSGVNGVYRNAEGIKGGDVWGKRSAWVALKAKKDNELITIVILDNPSNPNYPGWSHARGYGLFAMNNLGGRVFDKKAEEVKVVLVPGQKMKVSYKMFIGGDLSDQAINNFSKNYK